MTAVGKKGKKEKDKDAPKKPMGAFFCYQKTRREVLMKENPKLDNKQVVAVRPSHDGIENGRGVASLGRPGEGALLENGPQGKGAL